MWWMIGAARRIIPTMGTTMDDFLIRALIAGLGVAAVAGPLGCVLVWRRMAYFGNALSHAALLGVALGLMLAVNLTVSVILVCIAVAGLMIALEHQRRLSADTVLGILAHGALALGLVALSFLEGVRVDLTTFLFGDILSVSTLDLVWIYAGGAVGLAVLAVIWRPLLLIIVHRELAAVEGVRVQLIHTIYTLLIALVIGVAMKIVGVLLIISMLIIPAAAARRFAATPEAMALGAVVVGALAVVGGLGGSLTWDTPAGPSIVVCALALFVLAGGVVRLWRRSAEA